MGEGLTGTLLRFVQEWDKIADFLVFLLEEVGVPLPLPGDLTLVSLRIVLPLLGAGPLGRGLDIGPASIAGEVVRHLISGAMLRLACPLLLLVDAPADVRLGLARPTLTPAE